jgi:serine/threonine-protein kinase
MAQSQDREAVTAGGSATPERFGRVRAVFEAALERPAAERRAFAAGACGGDGDLLREVEAMLAAHVQPDGLLDRESQSSSAPDEGRFPAGIVLAGRYRVLGLLGKGGMGEVYKAFDLILNQTVALKFLAAGSVNEAALVRFRNEVRVARQVSHPNVCRVYDLGMTEGLHFLSMEYIDGEDLASLLRRIGRLPQDKAIEFTRKICAGLGAAHERGVLHRDLKPSNIMIDGRGQVRITDFGLAALAAEIPLSDLRSGTPAYMSPEQKAGKDVTTRSDIYSLGLVLHEMFTGKHRDDSQMTPSDIVKDLDPTIERLILRCLEEEPKRRPQTALNVAMALPGGDPIAAALAAGETPSPEMVAASQEKEGFQPRTAVLCLAGIVAAMIAGIIFQAQYSLLARAPITIRPDALADRVQALLRTVGYTGEPYTTNYGYYCCSDGGVQSLSRLGADQRANALANHQLRLTSFFYSQQDAPEYETLFRLRPFDIQPELPQGFIRIQLDARGRLVRLQAQPRADVPIASPVDWSVLFSAAGLDMTRFTPMAPELIPGVAIDTQVAWAGDLGSDFPEPVRVEAASWRGRPVEFRLDRVSEQADINSARRLRPIAIGIVQALTAVLSLGAIIVACRNVRQGRSDKRGAYAVLVTISVLGGLDYFFQPRHVTSPLDTPWVLLIGLCAIAYIATEPYVRRNWPDSLISWTRLCSGKIQNALVASHLLAALLIAAVWGNLVSPATDTIAGYGSLPGVAMLAAQAVEYLGGPGELLSHWAGSMLGGLVEALLLLVAIVLLRFAIRKLWLADLAAAILIAIIIGGPRPQAVVLLPAWLSFMWLLRRFGLLSFLVVYMMQRTLVFSPLRITDWVGMRFLPVHLLPLIIAAWAVWVILSAQRRGVTQTSF